ncbi:aspartate carbamoyltransferase catalytic subunit, partial [Lecanoromycetidae sp. Uapishka_2]
MSATPLSQSNDIPTLTELLNKSFLTGQHLLSVKQLGLSKLDQLLEVAREMRIAIEQNRVLNILNGVVLGEIFYEPSTRTSTSFDAAMKRVGGQTVILNESYSSTQKGESLEDTIRTVGQYTDAIVLRHPDEDAIDAAAIVSPVPIINGGNGAKEHPTQGLLDLLTIMEELGTIHGLTITFVGDLRYGRTVHSLCELLRHYRVTINLCSPPSLEMPSKMTQQIQDRGQLGVTCTELSINIVCESDVIYCTRIQKERFSDPKLYEKVKGSLTVDPNVMKNAKSKMILMHPLPRNREVTPEVDRDPRAAYFRQMKYGLFLRMALLSLILRH